MTAFDDKTTYAPFRLYSNEGSSAQFTLMLTDMSVKVMDQFESAGRHPGGYGWADMTLYVAAQDQAINTDAFGLDPEADMFIAYGKDLPTLKALAKGLHHLFHDKEALSVALKDAPYEYD